MRKFKTSLDEYTKEEIDKYGNGAYGGKRHDEICDYLEDNFKFSEEQLVNISVGIWLAIDSEKRVHEAKVAELEAENKEYKSDREKLVSILKTIRDCNFTEPYGYQYLANICLIILIKEQEMSEALAMEYQGYRALVIQENGIYTMNDDINYCKIKYETEIKKADKLEAENEKLLSELSICANDFARMKMDTSLKRVCKYLKN